MSTISPLSLLYFSIQYLDNKERTIPNQPLTSPIVYDTTTILTKHDSRGNKFVPRKDYKVKGVGNLMGNARTKKRI